MYCMNCNRHLAYCNCDDMDGKLKDLAHNPIVGQAARDNIAVRGRAIDPNIELLLNNLGKKIKVTFESKRYEGNYYQVCKVFDINPDFITMTPEETNYPEGPIHHLNTSRLRSVELLEGGDNIA